MKLIAALGAGLVLSALGWGQLPEFIPLSQVQPGMTGYGLTVVAGEEISRFEVEVVAVLDEPGERNDFIVVRVWGEAIARSGGIAQGMSGSPVYLEGKLAGALSRAARWSAEPERPLGLVTPIEVMLPVLAEAQAGSPPILPPGKKEPRGQVPQELKFVAAPPTSPQPGVLYAWPIASPVMASGLSPRAGDLLWQGVDLGFEWHPVAELAWPGSLRLPGLAELGFSRLVQAPSGVQTPSAPLAPGAPVGVGLLSGDITLGALGTVTLVQDGAVLAFGHPFLFSGRTDYFLTSAYIFDTVAALDIPYKLGSLGPVQGTVVADRWAAVAGVMGQPPHPVGLEFLIHDEVRGLSTQVAVDMARERRLSALLYYISGLGATDRALDRIGPGTAMVRYTITGAGMPRPLSRRNVFLSTWDIARYLPWEAALVTQVLEYNEFSDPQLLEIELEASVSDQLLAVFITDLVVDGLEYHPGDTLRFLVEFQDWRGQSRDWTGEILIPPDVETPYLVLRAYGGPRPPEKGEAAPEITSLEELIEYIEDIPSYDTLTVELFALDPISDLMGEPWLYGIGEVSLTVGGVVYGEMSLIIPFDDLAD